MSKPTNLKKVIYQGIHKHLGDYSSMGNYTPAYHHFLQYTGLSKEDVSEGYFKYFYKKLVTEEGFAQETSQHSLTIKKYNEQDAKNNRTASITVPILPADFEIKTFSPGHSVVDPKMFEVYSTSTEIDEIFSDDGGAMAACSVMICGGPGVGKSTLLFWMAAKYRELYPNARVAVVSSEMEQEDLLYEARRKPWMNQLEFILTSEYGENLKPAMEKIFDEGFDIIILDSFADVCDKLKDFNGMTGSAAELFVLELMKKTKGGKNKKGVFTLNLIIQQVTKGGSFAGSNKLKHNTTAMLELRRESSGDRYMTFSKNRRCGQHVGKKLYYFLGANNQVTFDSERWEREKAGDEEETSTNAGSDQINNNLLTQFGELTAESANRARLMMMQRGLTPELLESIRVNSVETLSLDGVEFPEGVSPDNAYEDTAIGFWILELPNNETPLFAVSKEEIIQKLIRKYKVEDEGDDTED